MTALKVKLINDFAILKVEDKPLKQYSGHIGSGVKCLLGAKITSEGDLNSSSFLPPISEDDVCTESDIFFKPTAIMEDESEETQSKNFDFENSLKKRSTHEGESPFLFRKHKGRNLESPRTPRNILSRFGCNAGSPQTPRTPNTPRSPCTPKTPKNSKSLFTTPKSKRGTPSRRLSSSKKSSQKIDHTPATVRAKLNRRIKRIYEDEDDSDENLDDSDLDADYQPSGSESEDEKTEWIKMSSKKCLSSKQISKKLQRRDLIDEDMEASTNDYFERNAEGSACLTSDHTLSSLRNPRLRPEALKSLLEDVGKSHEKEKQELLDEHVSHFPYWFTQLREGFSLFLVGVGSKKSLLSLFQEAMLEDLDHLVVNGFFPSLTVRSILSSIIEEIMGIESHPQGVIEQLRIITNHYNDSDVDPVFIIVNNLDGPMLRNEKAQFILSQLASLNSVHLIASLDHINSPLIFDGKKRSLYNPLWWDATTLASYVEETSYENSLLVQQSGDLALSSLIHVFKSLTPNAKGIFLILAKYQLNEKENSNYCGLSFVDLYQRCRESFLVNSDLTLRAQLTEFKDHKLLKLKKGIDGAENLIIPLSSSTLEEFIDQYDEK